MLSTSQISFEDYMQVHVKLFAPCLSYGKPSMLHWLLLLTDCQQPWSAAEMRNKLLH